MRQRLPIYALFLMSLILAGAGCGTAVSRPASQKIPKETSLKDAAYVIDGATVTLVDGVSVKTDVPGAASKTVTRYFGNEATGDLNGDGRDDVAFLLTRESGGSGTFFYVAAALRTDAGYQGTNAILLGDRIAPQTTEIKDGRITVNFADRKPGEPFTAPPSVGVSKYFQVRDGQLVAAPAAADTGAASGLLTEAEAKAIAEKTCIKGGEALGPGYHNDYTKTWWFDANLNATREGCNPACVVSDETGQAEINWRCTGLKMP